MSRCACTIGLILASCAQVVVEGVSPPVSPEHLTTERFEVPLNEPFAFTLPPDVDAASLLVRVPEARSMWSTLGVQIEEGPDTNTDGWQGLARSGIYRDWSAADGELAGPWSLRFGGSLSDGLLDVVLQHRPRVDRPTITVQFLWTQGFGTEEDVALDTIVEDLRNTWSEFGIDVQTYRQTSNLPSTCKKPGNSIWDTRYLDASATGADHDVTVVLCKRVKDTNAGLTFSGATVASPISAVLVTWLDPETTAWLISHELGHVGGLKHLEDDELLDTPACDVLEECRRLAADNIMVNGPGIKRMLTPMQQDVVRNWVGAL